MFCDLLYLQCTQVTFDTYKQISCHRQQSQKIAVEIEPVYAVTLHLPMDNKTSVQ